MGPPNECVRRGIWLYDGTVTCRVEIWRRAVRPGSGDYEDEAEWRNDQEGEWYEVQYLPPPDGLSVTAGGGYYDQLGKAIDAVRVATHSTVRWDAEGGSGDVAT
jgi:hypothetical protein